MNTQQPYEHPAPVSPPPLAVQAEAARSVEPDTGRTTAQTAVAPEAIAAATVSREQEREGLEVDRPTRGVDWVRASDLLARGSGAISRRGIDLDAKLGYKARHGIAVGAKFVGRKTVQAVRKLPPLSAFGRDGETVEPRGLGRA